MNPRLLIKIGAIFFTALLLLIPVFQIQGLVSERRETRDSVVQEMARSAGYAQTITGPVLIVPYTRKVRSWSEPREGEPRRLIETEVTGRLAFLPADFELSGKLQVDERQRGIYHARIFDADTRITGAFELAANYGVTTDLTDRPAIRFTENVRSGVAAGESAVPAAAPGVPAAANGSVSVGTGGK